MRVTNKTDGPISSQTMGTGALPSVPAGAGTGSPAAPSSLPTDALSVSSGAQFISAAQATLAGIPEVRTDKVEAIRAQITTDTYNPPADAVADGLVKAHSPQRLGT